MVDHRQAKKNPAGATGAGAGRAQMPPQGNPLTAPAVYVTRGKKRAERVMHSDSSRQWLERADEARARALELPDPESRRLLLHVAETYDKLTQRVEAQEPPKTSS
jgi:hypothetical protein